MQRTPQQFVPLQIESALTPRPAFTDAEQYLINAVRSTTAATEFNLYMWSYIIAGVFLAGFAGYYENVLMMASAFVVVCGFRIYEDRYQRRWTPVWRSIIEKYETTIIRSDKPINDEAIRESLTTVSAGRKFAMDELG